MCGAGPGDLGGGSRGSVSAENQWKTGPNISSQTAFKYLLKIINDFERCLMIFTTFDDFNDLGDF